MDVYEALYTTRAMRRLRPDPIPLDVQARILDAAIRAPSGNNTQDDIRFLLVDDADLKARLAPLYRDTQDRMMGIFADRVAAAEAEPDEPGSAALLAMVRSIRHLGAHFEEVPLLLFGFMRSATVEGFEGQAGDRRGAAWRSVPRAFADDNDAAEIFPAIWSAMLAARAEGIGTTLTTALGAFHVEEVFEILGVPTGEGWTMYCCVTLGYPTGRWGLAARQPVGNVTHRNRWGTSAGLPVVTPSWT
ncbi:MAG: nitroreductase family protein [Acidimicrobiia bacterium]